MHLVNTDVAGMRLSYTSGYLEDAVGAKNAKNPIALFDEWLTDAKKTEHEANAMTISTAGKDARPNARIVLLKAFDQRGFVFYTNYNSRKSQNLIENPWASITFYWKERQVRIEGSVTKTSAEESDAYFASRPRGSQIGAWVSNLQSSKVESRAVLESREAEIEKQFEGVDPVPRPDFWGGWRVSCDRIEFWQGRPGRIHDRIVFEKKVDANVSDGEWDVARLMP
ncbi:pyridoxine/pyridoxamine 5'-phosphate oxidase [Rhizoclosmatium globosum]|uniref:pyridoxal 5'-phosphate synthase n=1 Tax=Rhizoclosmatium globosum TaxID=329046 RepID=A0A1Y2BN27_9FUNG|nr:pyridoxine/pyridoxamine 5'-phosphate oxidase [Rhizoclosmatium globosum]|eukprot:ORY36143.1 pyridoxine/pyridoxamine 5'-phosphate oxidase [Rhizoclosmatium globosum]